MTLTFVRGDIFASRAQTLPNPVNCVGVMGAGLALEFKRRFHTMFQEYVLACREGALGPGHPYLWRHPTGPWVLRFPTKAHWKDPASLGAIQEGLSRIANDAEARGITSLSLPALGCGLGGLAWADVRPLVVRAPSSMSIPIEVYTT
ncbi:MAG: macro domain-containing protein [Euryarchaeota archaeon]|nr:macro domain-containing protein [Euryarchaeota archaeon]MDE1837215.1 macro domain-containing protein [Euryarchaeota archaeon]MDE1881419.1 macro domain-containing protein [Euryarchaeota archaeon]MDE2045371.1 macro domain-containing protein [Thermoplasmata archaeon]